MHKFGDNINNIHVQKKEGIYMQNKTFLKIHIFTEVLRMDKVILSKKSEIERKLNPL